MQDKDEELQTIYRRLSEACKERSDVRSALIGTQSELAETQAELDAWTHELDSFQQVLLFELQLTFHDPRRLLQELLLHDVSPEGCLLT